MQVKPVPKRVDSSVATQDKSTEVLLLVALVILLGLVVLSLVR